MIQLDLLYVSYFSDPEFGLILQDNTSAIPYASILQEVLSLQQNSQPTSTIIKSALPEMWIQF